jgi:hypothetical protein
MSSDALIGVALAAAWADAAAIGSAIGLAVAAAASTAQIAAPTGDDVRAQITLFACHRRANRGSARRRRSPGPPAPRLLTFKPHVLGVLTMRPLTGSATT